MLKPLRMVSQKNHNLETSVGDSVRPWGYREVAQWYSTLGFNMWDMCKKILHHFMNRHRFGHMWES